MTAKTETPELVTPAAMPAAPVVSGIDDAATMYLYIVPGGTFTVRKATGKSAADRPVIFEPSGETDRYTLTTGVVRAYLAESDAAKRDGILAGAEPLQTTSRVQPDAALWELAKSFIAEQSPADALPVETLRALVKSGILVVPAKPRKVRAAKTAADTTDAALDELFA